MISTIKSKDIKKARKRKLAFLPPVLALIFWLLLWELASLWVKEALFLPSPVQVGKAWISLCGTAEFYRATAYSLLRICEGLLLGTAIGMLLAVMGAMLPMLRPLLTPLLTAMKATPVASVIILFWSWIGGARLPMFISALMVIPIFYANLLEGLAQIPKELREVATVFDFSLGKRLRYLYFPFVFPYFLSAFLTAIGLAWKAGIATEILAYTANSIGKEIYRAKSSLEIAELFAWTATVVVISLILEFVSRKLLIRVMQRRHHG